MGNEQPGGKGDTKPAGDQTQTTDAAAAAAAAAAAGAGDNKPGEKPDDKAGEKKPDDTGKPAEKSGDGKQPDPKAAETLATGEPGKKADGTEGEKPGEKKAPEKYTLTLPSGGHVDAVDVTALEKVARANNWTNEEAQATLDAHADAVAAQSAHYLEQTKADPTYGGEQLEATLKHSRAVLDRVRPAGTPRGDAFRQLLNKTGYGNHVEVIGFLADLGKLMAEDKPLTSHGAADTDGEKKSIASRLYGDSSKASN